MEVAFARYNFVRKLIFAQYEVKCDIFYKICIFFVVLMKYQPLESLKYIIFFYKNMQVYIDEHSFYIGQK